MSVSRQGRRGQDVEGEWRAEDWGGEFEDVVEEGGESQVRTLRSSKDTLIYTCREEHARQVQ